MSFSATALVEAPLAAAHQAGVRTTNLRLLGWLPALCVVLPLLAYAGVGAYRYQEIRSETHIRLDRALRIAAEHALKVFDTSEGLLGRVKDLVDAAPPESATGRQGRLQEQLGALAEKKLQLQGIWVIGPDGLVSASSRLAAPAISVTDRDYFRWHKQGKGGLYVSRPLIARATGEPILDLSIARKSQDGGFGGVVTVSLRTKYFESFHADLVADEPGLAITMLREDGAIFSRWPELARAPPSLSPNSPVMSRIRAGMAAGKTLGVSSVDGQERFLAFQKVGDYPVYLGTGMDLSDMRWRWLREMAWLAAFGLPPILGLFWVARLALRRSRESIASAQRLQQETEARRKVEEALLQSQKLEALGRLTGGVAHDFNNALMVLSNNLAVLKIKSPEAIGPQLDSMVRAVSSATKLTRQLLAFSRRQAMVPEHVLLQERLPTMRELLVPVLGSVVQLDISAEPDTRPIRVDAAEFELALINLAINARDAMGQKGLFRVVARNADDDLPPLLQAPMVVVEAVDNGPGIPPDVLGKVFEPFFTTKPVGEGTGLGLSQVYGLCQRAGGLATIHSDLGRGTTVRMFFPPDLLGPAAEAPSQVFPRNLGKHVLLVEDNAEVAAALKPVLEALGCRVTALDRAAAALDWLARHEQLPDLLMTDVVMPGELGGIALAQHVHQRWPTLKVIMITGYAEQMETIVGLGFPVLPKPCSLDMLGEAIEKAFRPSAR